MISVEILKKTLLKLDRYIFNYFFLRIYNQIKYNIKLFIIKFYRKEIDLKKNHNLNKKLVVSLTSYPKRFRTLPLVLNSIKNQSIKPDEIVLWIENKDKKKLPSQILNFKGIKINFCENGLLSYKKIIPTINKYKNSYIITFDDDVIYFRNSIEQLVSKSKKFPKNVIANCIHKIELINFYPISYKLWKRNYKKQTKFAFFTGTAGVLYPPNCFYKDILKKNYFQKLAPLGDDIWLNWMVRLNKVEITFSKIKKNYELIKTIKGGLYKKNFKGDYNDIQIRNMIKKYGFPF